MKRSSERTVDDMRALEHLETQRTGPDVPSNHPAPCERGIALLVAIVASLALALVGMTLVRAVATGAAIAGNLAARQQATFAASAAIEHAVATVYGAGALDTTVDDTPRNYYASRQPGEDRRGVPRVLQSLADFPADASVVDAGDGFTARHVIERLCLAAGAATAFQCTLSPPSVDAAAGAPPPGEPPRTPYYRVTVRVDGPAAAAAFVQVMLGGAPNHRLSWRVLDE
jgi:Tfp pilus assembly protein PilX